MADRTDQMVIKFRDVLAATERLSPAELTAYQRQLLVPLLKHARSNVPFYRTRLAPLFHGDEVDLNRWSEIPILTRAEAQSNTRALAATVVPPHLGRVSRDETSGSTGRPVVFSTNELHMVAARAMTDRLYRWWGLDGHLTMATYISRRKVPAPAPDGVTYEGWRVGFPSGLHHLIDMSADTDQQIDWLVKRRPHYLTAYSSTLRPLAERVRERGIKLRFERIIGVSSLLPHETRTVCREVFGAPLIDQYGADEAGSIATDCPNCGLYHIAAESVLVEVLDDMGRPCAPGETGRVIVTPFYSYATGFIRYEIGDYATVGLNDTRCPVRLPTLKRIIGRYRNTFRLADGRIIYPLFSIAKLKALVPMVQFQVVQTSYDEIEVRYVPAPGAGPADEGGLGTYLRQELDPGFRISVVVVNDIPRSPSGKFEDFVSLVDRKAPTSPTQ